MNKNIKLLSFLILSIVLVYFTICFQAAYSLIYPPHELITKTPKDFGLNYKDVEFKTTDNIKIKGWLMMAVNPRGTVIVLHGYKRSRIELLENGYDDFLVKNGFNILSFDFRGHGQSEGKTTLGYHEIKDVHAAVAFLQNRNYSHKKIGLFGISLGGSIALIAAGSIPEIYAIVSDSAFNRINDIIATGFERNTNLPPIFFAPLTIKFAEILGGVSTEKISPLNYIDKISHGSAVLIIHGKFDDYIPVSNAQKLYQKANQPKFIWLTDSSHAESFNKFISEYKRVIVEFFGRYLN